MLELVWDSKSRGPLKPLQKHKDVPMEIVLVGPGWVLKSMEIIKIQSKLTENTFKRKNNKQKDSGN